MKFKKNNIKERQHKNQILLVLVLILSLIFTGCTGTTNESSSESSSIQVIAATENEGDNTSTNKSDDQTNTTYIKLDQEISIEGDQEGVSIDGSVIRLSKGGTYDVSGTLENGQILIEGHDEIFTLILNGVDITNDDGPAILTLDAEHTYIILSSNSVNQLTDGGQDEDHEAPLFSCDDMTISGEGILNIFGNNQEGIESNDILTINGGDINITVPDDGLNAGDGIVINGGNIIINSGGDGVDSNGYLTINGGYINVSAGNNANGPLDIGEGDYKFIINGGTVVASGGNMGITADESSTQNVIWIYGTIAEGEVMTIIDADNNAIFTTTIPKAASAVFISTDLLEIDNTYTISRTDKDDETIVISSLSTTVGEIRGMGGKPNRNMHTPPEGSNLKPPANDTFTPPTDENFTPQTNDAPPSVMEESN